MYLADPKERKSFLLNKIGLYITRILRVFGCTLTLPSHHSLHAAVIPDNEIGWSTEEAAVSREKTLAPILDVLAQFRSDVRQAASKPALM